MTATTMADRCVPAHGFIEGPDGRGRLSPERNEEWERERLREEAAKGEVQAVVYHDDGGAWRPHSIFTTEGEYDAQFSARRGELYVDLAGGGGGGPYVHRYVTPTPAPARIWIRSGVRVHDGYTTQRRYLSDAELLKRGYRRIDGPPPSPFVDTCEGKLYWIESAKDWLTYEETFECRNCCEREDHRHRGALLVVFDADDVGLDDAGLYLIKRWPFYTSPISSWLHADALLRLGDVPPGVEKDGYYPCGFLCGTCSARVRRGLERRAQRRTRRKTREVCCG
jgi:hypothetical protein